MHLNEPTPDPPIPISALEHHIYCPRQCALIYADGLWTDNEHTVRGTAGHQRVDTTPSRIERGYRIERQLALWSETHGLTGRADAVAVDCDGHHIPVEYKIGVRHGETAHIQLCAQALCLEEMFAEDVRYGFVWYSSTRHRTRVEIGEDLRSATVTALAEIRGWLSAETLPPAVDDGRCGSCQFLLSCQPSLTAHPDRIARYLKEALRYGS